MIEQLKALHQNSYVPISQFPVSACVVTKDDSIDKKPRLWYNSFGYECLP